MDDLLFIPRVIVLTLVLLAAHIVAATGAGFTEGSSTPSPEPGATHAPAEINPTDHGATDATAAGAARPDMAESLGLPEVVRLAHIAETAPSNFIFGVGLAWLARRRVR